MAGLILVPVQLGQTLQQGQHKRRSRSGDDPTGPVGPIFSSQVGRESWRGYTATGRERIYLFTNLINNWDNWDSQANATTGAGKICPSFKSLSQLNRDRGFSSPVVERDTDLRPPSASFSRKSPHACKRLAPLLPERRRRTGPGDYRALPPDGRRGSPPSNQYDRFDAADIGLVESGCPARRWQVVPSDTRF